jgi:hypothetical protein
MNKCNRAKQRQQEVMQHTDIGSEEATQFGKGNIHKFATYKGSKAARQHTGIQQLAKATYNNLRLARRQLINLFG